MARRVQARRIGSAVLVTALLWGTAGQARAGSGDGGERGRAAGCRAELAGMWERYNRAFDARDVGRLMAHYRSDAVKVDPDGSYHQGAASVGELFAGLFTLDFTSEFREVRRTVAGCDTAVLVLNSTLSVPEWGHTERFMSVLSFTHERGRWRVVANVSTPLAG
ncbi:nuclear transport factor 2 family protein [Streptomyces sp. CAU 1734]|uniref:YybH family protein n=1 Tax=Streptomyces sp. CAU 1734 TaxID=3140360 RepID=UPI0032602CB1